MDIQHLVDRLEELIDEGRHIFGTKYTLIDEERALEIIDQMRISIPEEIEKSSRVIQNRERVLAEAHEEAARIIQQTREKAEGLIDQDSLVQAAQARAESIREQARQEAGRITAEADQYVMDLLSRLEQQLTLNLDQVRNGISMLNRPSVDLSRSAPAQPLHMPRPVDHDASEVYVDAGYDYEEKG